MPTIALERPETRVEPGYRGFLDLAEAGRARSRTVPAPDREGGARPRARAAGLASERQQQDLSSGIGRPSPLAPGLHPCRGTRVEPRPRWNTVVLSPRWR